MKKTRQVKNKFANAFFQSLIILKNCFYSRQSLPSFPYSSNCILSLGVKLTSISSMAKRNTDFILISKALKTAVLPLIQNIWDASFWAFRLLQGKRLYSHFSVCLSLLVIPFKNNRRTDRFLEVVAAEKSLRQRNASFQEDALYSVTAVHHFPYNW